MSSSSLINSKMWLYNHNAYSLMTLMPHNTSPAVELMVDVINMTCQLAVISAAAAAVVVDC